MTFTENLQDKLIRLTEGNFKDISVWNFSSISKATQPSIPKDGII